MTTEEKQTLLEADKKLVRAFDAFCHAAAEYRGAKGHLTEQWEKALSEMIRREGMREVGI